MPLQQVSCAWLSLLPCLFAAGHIIGAPAQTVAPGGLSPNHKFAAMIVAQGEADDEGAQPLLVIRHRADGVTLGQEIASGYATYKGPAWPVNTVALWRLDSAFVAVKTRGTKTSTSVLLFRVSADRAERVRMPDLWQAIRGRLGLTEGGRFYFEAPLRWTKAGELVVEVTGNTMDSGTEDSPET